MRATGSFIEPLDFGFVIRTHHQDPHRHPPQEPVAAVDQKEADKLQLISDLSCRPDTFKEGEIAFHSVLGEPVAVRQLRPRMLDTT